MGEFIVTKDIDGTGCC